MSSDSQLKKKKDVKKKRKDDEAENEDINIHIHKEGGTGGGICAKIVFIFLSSALVVLVGLIIKENQGLTELENIESESRFAEAFEGWIEENVDDHSPEILSYENDDHEKEGSEEITSNEETEDDTGEEEQESHETEISQEEGEDDEEDIATEEDTEDEDSQPQSDEEEETTEENKNDPVNIEENEDEKEGKEIEEVEKPVEVKKEYFKTRRRFGNKLSKYISTEEKGSRKITLEEDTKQESESFDVDNDDNQSNNDKFEENKAESNEEDIIAEEPIAANQDKNEDKSAEKGESQDETLLKIEEKESPGEEPSDDQKESQVTDDRSGISTKIGVGLALLVVAYKVFLRKRSTDYEAPSPRIVTENTDQPSTLSRRNTIVPPPSLEDIEADLYQVEDPGNYSEEEYSDEEYLGEHQRSPREEYQELRTTYSRSITSEDDFISKSQEKIEDLEDLDYVEEEYLEEEQSAEDTESPEDDDDDDEELLKRLEAKYGKLGREVTVPSIGAESDSDRMSEDDYEFSNISNAGDQKTKTKADEAH